MNKITRDFVSEEKREYRFKIGQLLASALSGFLAGVIVASIVWMIALQYLMNMAG